MVGRSFGLLFFVSKMAKNGNGVTIGVTNRGYTFGVFGGRIEGEGKG